MKNAKQVDKDPAFMVKEHGTVCLVTEAGKADQLLDLAHKRRVNRERFVNSPIDSWDI